MRFSAQLRLRIFDFQGGFEMKSTRKIVSLVLAAVLMMSLFVIVPISASAAGFTQRYSAPSSSDKNFINVNYGGYNKCIAIDGNGFVLPNCTGYAWGRAREIIGSSPNLSTSNACNWYGYNQSTGAYPCGNTPKVGAIACWSGGSEGYGHVAVVEEINGNRVTISESGYRWKTFNRRDIYNNYYGASYNFQGYIYLPVQVVPYQKPEIVRTYINYQNANSYRVNIEVKNVESISSVQVATWTQQDQSDLHWNMCSFNGYATFFIDLSRKDFAANQKSYCNDVYVYDTYGKNVAYERIGTIYQDSKIVRTYINYQKADSYRVNVEVTNVESIESVRVATWTQQDQSDLHWNYCYFNGYGTYFIDLSRNDFAANQKSYCNDIYVYDGSGKCVGYERIGTIYKDAKLVDVRVTKHSSKGYRVVAKVDSQFGVSSAQYPTWTENNGQDDLVWHSASVSGNYISCYIKASEHNNETSRYITHLYFTDSIGQTFSFTGIIPYIYLNDEINEIDSIVNNNHKYVLYNHEFTWTEAKEWCESQGGHLVTIGDSEEWEAVKELLSQNGGIPVWLGGERIKDTNNFKWVDDTPFSFEDWEEGEPNNTNENENYIGTNNGNYYLDCYLWNDYNNNPTRIGGFICEYDEVETPTEPTSSENNITEPSSSENQPTESSTSESQPTEPSSSENKPTEPSSSESQPTEPSSSESNPTEPSSSESNPTETQPSKTDISKWNVSGIKNKTYTGRVIKQDNIIVSKDGEYADFSVKYKGNLNVGIATVIITGTGDYTGTITTTFKITKANNPIKVTAKKTVTANSKKKTTIKKAITVTKAQGKVTYTTNNKKVTVKNGTITIAKGLKKGKTISVKVTITAKGNDNYKSKSVTKMVTIKIK